MVVKTKSFWVRCLAERFVDDRSGATAIEYGILMMMVGIALVGIMTLGGVSGKMSTTFLTIADQLR
ncbi:Flp family type IVb pilin [Chthonobacter albigriseus]|uniref:Flp family type IVb pilin n=1 Tax=Chthonobacter albigriseus TaxID=1683161 RepID=UPI0015EE8EF7|nr:Flp family type IVb pilin [Chthonobacter albigriseus]